MKFKENDKVKIHDVNHNEDCEDCIEENAGVHPCESMTGFVLWIERGVAGNPYGVAFDNNHGQTCSFAESELEKV